MTYVESAHGLMNLKDILTKAWDYSKDRHYKIDGVVFGSDDFCADIGKYNLIFFFPTYFTLTVIFLMCMDANVLKTAILIYG